MWRDTDNNAKWCEAVEAAAKRLDMCCWLFGLYLFMHGIKEYYTQLDAEGGEELLKVLECVKNPKQDLPVSLELEQFLQVIDVWRQFHKKYQTRGCESLSMFDFLHTVWQADKIDVDHKKKLCRVMLEATIAYYEVFRQEAGDALEYIVLESVTNSLTFRPVTDNFQCDLMIQQFQSHSQYCRSVSDSMKDKFRMAIILKPTGGDFHNRGKTPLFVRCGSEEYVLKPRNMHEEQCIDSMLELFNRTMPGLELPLSGGIEEINVDGGKHYALVRKSTRQCKMTVDQARAYFKKVGALLFMIKLFGIEDLHGENIMTTDAGPVIIDGECLFNYSYMSKKDMYNVNLGKLVDAFNDGTAVLGTTNNVFICLNSSSYCAEVSKVHQLTEYGTAVVQGFQTLAAEIRKEDKKGGFIEEAYGIYRKMVLDQEAMIRIVLVGTSKCRAVFYATGETFTEGCRSLRNSVKENLPKAFEGVVDSAAENYEWVEDADIDNLITASIKSGNVPFFYLQDVKSETSPQKKLKIMLSESVICTVNLDRGSEVIKTVFEENLNWLLSEDAVQSLQSLLVKEHS